MILRIIIGVQFAVGIKIISDATEKQYPLPVDWSFTLIAVVTVLTLPLLAVAGAFMKSAFMG